MTKVQNARFIRIGINSLSVSLFFLFVIINFGADIPENYPWVAPVLVGALFLSGLSTMIFGFILGLMPHYLRFDKNMITSEAQKKNPIYILALKD